MFSLKIYSKVFLKVMKALKMSIIHVLAFIVSWTPYTVMGTWYDCESTTFVKLDTV